MNEFTDYQLSKKWVDLTAAYHDYHGWRVKEGRFNTPVAIYPTKEECENFISQYNQAIKGKT